MADAGAGVERFEPDAEVVRAARRIMRAAGIEVGGVEYLVDDRDGRRYFYDVNALSNFVADAPRVVGFDPFVTLVDWLEEERRNAVAPGIGASRSGQRGEEPVAGLR